MATRYDAFISYNHAADLKLALAVRSALHGFAKPWYRLRALSVFLDQSDLAADPRMWSRIQDAIGKARFFLLMASPQAAASPWVRKEVDQWLSQNSVDRFLIILTHGSIEWDEEAGDFDWDKTDALPPNLRGCFKEEPKYVDLRRARDPTHLSLRQGDFRRCILDLAAPLHGRPKSELDGEDVQEFRKTRRVVRFFIIGLIAFLVLVIILGVYSNAQRLKAEYQTRIARAQALAAQANEVRLRYPQRSLLLAVEAVKTSKGAGCFWLPVAEQALRDSLSSIGGTPVSHQGAWISWFMFSPDGQWLATGGADKAARLWQLKGTDPSAAPIVLRGHDGAVSAGSISPDARYLATGSTDATVRLWDLCDPNAAPLILRGYEGPVMLVVFSPDRRWLVTMAAQQDGPVRLWDLNTADGSARPIILRDQPQGDFEYFIPRGFHTPSRVGGWRNVLGFSPDSHWLAIRGAGVVWLHDLSAADPNVATKILGARGGVVGSFSFSRDGHWLATSNAGMVRLWDLGASDPSAAPIVLQGHEEIVTVIRFDPSGNWLLTSSIGYAGPEPSRASTRLWHLKTAKPDSVLLSLNDRTVVDAGFSRDGRWLAIVCGDGTVWSWNVGSESSTLSPTALGSGPRSSNFLRCGPDSRWLAVAARVPDNYADYATSLLWEDSSVSLWDMKADNPAEKHLILRGHDKGLWGAAFAQNGRWLATGSMDSTVRLWDLDAENAAAVPLTLPQTPHVQGDDVSTATFSPDGRWLVTDNRWHTTLRLWDLKATNPSPTSLLLTGHDRSVTDVSFSRDGRWLAAGSDLWDLGTEKPMAKPLPMLGDQRAVEVSAFSPNGRWFAVGSDDHTVRLWDLRARGPAATPLVLAGHERPITAVSFNADGWWLATGSDDQTIRLWDLESDNPVVPSAILRGQGYVASTIRFSSNGRWLATAAGGMDMFSTGHAPRLWDLQAKDPAATPLVLHAGEKDSEEDYPAVGTLHAVRGDPHDVAFSPDSRWLATCDGGKIVRLWDLKTKPPGAVQLVLRGHKDIVHVMSFSPDGRWLASAADQLYAGGDNEVRLWDLKADNPAASPLILRGHQVHVTCMAISPDGYWLATGSQDKSVRLWNLRADNPAAVSLVLRGHEGDISTVSFSPDGRWLATGSADGTVRLWPAQIEGLVEIAGQVAGRNLSPEEWDEYLPGQPYQETFRGLPIPK